MISLDNITIAYQEELIKNGAITIQDSKITCLIGKSGSGKTSLLYIIGLLINNSNVSYYFNHYKLDFKDANQLSQIRRLKIGYVFQENNTLDMLTIEENFNYIAHLCHINTNKDIMNELLQTVHLSKPLDFPTHLLSGGEKQRLAIALALSKDPDLIVLDEPTSALDKDNSLLIMKVLNQIAHTHSKMVIIASHSKVVSEYSDVIYEIKNKQLITQQEEIPTKSSSSCLIHKNKFKNFYTYYIKLHLKKQKKLYLTIFTILSFIISACTISKILSNLYVNYQLAKIENNDIEKVVISTNQELYQTTFYQEGNGNIDKNLIYNVIDQNPTIDSFMYYKEWIISEFYLDDMKIEQTALIKPYKYKQEIEKKLYTDYQNTSNLGIYVSYHLVSNPDQKIVNIKFSIDEVSYSLPISGISSAYDTNDISLYKDTPIIYVPYDKVDSLLTESSTCILYTANKDTIAKIIQDTKNLDITIGASSSYQGQTSFYQDSIDKITTITTFFSYTLYLLAIVSIALVYFKIMLNRSYEIAILKANGMSNKEISKMILYEIFIHLTIIILSSSAIMIIIQTIINNLFNYTFLLFNFTTFVSSVCLSIFTLVIPVFITLKIMLKSDPVKILRE